MELFEQVFNRLGILDMLFFNCKAVLEYPTLDDLQEKNPALYGRWKYLSKSKYDIDFDVDYGEPSTEDLAEKVYQDKAIFYPEFSRIVTISYATLYMKDGKINRFFKKISNEDEYIVLANFVDILYQLSSDGVKSSPPYFPTLCGHNITNYDIPLIIKRMLKHKARFEAARTDQKSTQQLIPFILKNCLSAKPWEGRVVDTVNVWKFNGNDFTPLMLISDYLGLKKTVDLLPLSELSKYYWENVTEKPEDTLEYISLQSSTQTNLVIQLMNELRQV